VVTQRRGAPCSTADAYLRPALRRKNLKLITEATATRVVFDGQVRWKWSSRRTANGALFGHVVRWCCLPGR
jgi:choline dehydrogenase-like flavoprotein